MVPDGLAADGPGGSAADAPGESAPGTGIPGESATAKLEVILGSEGLGRLAASTVMVVGLGGVGSSCAEALARGGVGRLVIADRDSVQPSNINRQAIAFTSTLGQRKTEVMRAMVADINPDAEVIAHDGFVLPENIPGLFTVRPDYIVDAIDTVVTKLALAAYAEARGIPLVSSMGAGNKLHPEALRFADISQTSHCPLCRVIRKEARRRGISRLRVLYSCEEPVVTAAHPGAARAERSGLGTVSYMPPIMGQMIAGEVIRTLAGVGCAPTAEG